MHPQPGDPTHNPNMCPDWESNQWPLGSQAGAQSTKLHQPGLIAFLIAALDSTAFSGKSKGMNIGQKENK